jgi:hypothetical protein
VVGREVPDKLFVLVCALYAWVALLENHSDRLKELQPMDKEANLKDV